MQRIETLDQLETLLALAEDMDRTLTFEELLWKTLIRPIDLPEVARSLVAQGLAVAESERSLRLSEDTGVRRLASELLRQFRENPALIVGPLSMGSIELAQVVVDRARARSSV
jgi:hypothetical protein